jgi:alpha-galactosidase
MSPREGEQAATESVSRDGKQAAVFAYLHSSTQTYPYPRLYLRGLDENAIYDLHPVAGKVNEGTPVKATGAYWMHHGVDLALRGDFQAAMFTLERQ